MTREGAPENARLLAVQELVVYYKNKYPGDNQFFFHRNVNVEYSRSFGVCLKATGEISPDEIIIKLPPEERICYETVGTIPMETQSGREILLSQVLDTIIAYCHTAAFQRPRWGLVQPCAIATSVLVMFLAHNETRFSKVVATWPSLAELREQHSAWKELSQIYTEYMQKKQEDEDGLVCGFLHKFFDHNGVLSFFCSPDEDFLEQYQYASHIVRSRAHRSDDFKSDLILPFIDVINGLPECSLLNVRPPDISENYRSVVRARTAIIAGQQLLIRYGQRLSPSIFCFTYGLFPGIMRAAEEFPLRDHVLVRLPASHCIDLSDDLRQNAIHHHGCKPLDRNVYIFAPHLLDTIGIPQCLKNLVVYLRIKTATIDQLQNKYTLEEIGQIEDRPDIDSSLTRAMEVIVHNRTELVYAKRRAEQNDIPKERKEVVLMLFQCAQDTMFLWNERLSTIINRSQAIQ